MVVSGLNHGKHVYNHYLEVCGSKGRLVARDAGFCDTTTTRSTRVMLQSDRSAQRGGMMDTPDRLYKVEGTTFSKSNAPIFTGPLAALFSDMVGTIRDGRTDGSPSFAEAAHVHRAVEAAERSMRTGRWEQVDG